MIYAIDFTMMIYDYFNYCNFFWFELEKKRIATSFATVCSEREDAELIDYWSIKTLKSLEYWLILWIFTLLIIPGSYIVWDIVLAIKYLTHFDVFLQLYIFN